MRELNAILTIAYRDMAKFLRDRTRLIASLIFPIVFVAILGGSLQANIGLSAGYDFLVFTFTGVFAQTLFLSSTQGVISLIEDRESDFSQEIFVAPISRYSIVFGKILGESLVALVQGAVVVLFGLLIGVPLTFAQVLGLIPVALVVCLLGGAFGVLILGNISSQRAANQIFPFVVFPQFFLAGVFSPIKVLPLYLDVLSRISPMRYAVDLARGVFYTGRRSEYDSVVLARPLTNMGIIGAMFAVFLFLGTTLFVRRERNR